MDIREIFADPEFRKMDVGDKIKVMSHADPEFGQLPAPDQVKVLVSGLYPQIHDQEPKAQDKGFWATIGEDIKALPGGLAHLVTSPFETGTQMGRAQVEQGKQAFQSFKRGDTVEGLGHTAAALLPIIGPAAAEAGNLIGEGKTGEGMAKATELLAPSLVRGGTQVVKAAAREAAVPGTMQAVGGVGRIGVGGAAIVKGGPIGAAYGVGSVAKGLKDVSEGMAERNAAKTVLAKKAVEKAQATADFQEGMSRTPPGRPSNWRDVQQAQQGATPPQPQAAPVDPVAGAPRRTGPMQFPQSPVQEAPVPSRSAWEQVQEAQQGSAAPPQAAPVPDPVATAPRVQGTRNIPPSSPPVDVPPEPNPFETVQQRLESSQAPTPTPRQPDFPPGTQFRKGGTPFQPAPGAMAVQPEAPPAPVQAPAPPPVTPAPKGPTAPVLKGKAKSAAEKLRKTLVPGSNPGEVATIPGTDTADAGQVAHMVNRAKKLGVTSEAIKAMSPLERSKAVEFIDASDQTPAIKDAIKQKLGFEDFTFAKGGVVAPGGEVLVSPTPMAEGGIVVPEMARSGEDIIRGSSNIPLSSKGLEQAKELGGKFKAKGGVHHIESSDLKRAEQTAHAIGKSTPTPNLRPWHLGEIEGQPTAKVIDRIHRYVTKQPNVKVPGKGPESTAPGESFNSFKRRFLTTLQGKMGDLKKDPGKKIALVTHYRDVRLAQAWASRGFPSSFDINPKFMTEKGSDPPGTVLRLYFKGSKPVLAKINMDTPGKLPGGIYLVRHGVTKWNAENKGEVK